MHWESSTIPIAGLSQPCPLAVRGTVAICMNNKQDDQLQVTVEKEGR